jgi:hypothetical protein
MEQIDWLKGQKFVCPADYKPGAAVQRRLRPDQWAQTYVRIRFDKAVPGGIEISIDVAGTTELVSWVLCYGDKAEVLEPARRGGGGAEARCREVRALIRRAPDARIGDPIAQRGPSMSPTSANREGYQARSVWYLKYLGPPTRLIKNKMEDGTDLAVFEIDPSTRPNRSGVWTYITNGMAERRMPCVEEPHGDPSIRLELMAYSNAKADWIVELLTEMARYPFQHSSGFAVGHTIPVDSGVTALWQGYVLTKPLLEDEEFNPQNVFLGSIPDDPTLFIQVIGLRRPEVEWASEHGGPAFLEHLRAKFPPVTLRALSCLDVPRDPIALPDQ